MDEPLDALEQEMVRLRAAVRTAVARREDSQAQALQVQLARAEVEWAALVTPHSVKPAPLASGWQAPLESKREMIQQTLALIGAPAAPKLIRAVHQTFFAGDLPASRMAPLRRDEERSFTTMRAERTYICPALTADRLTPARGLLTLSTWPLEQRIVAATSARIDFLTMAIRIVEAAERLGPRPGSDRQGVEQLLHRIAFDLPGALGPTGTSPDLIRTAAQSELDVSAAADRAARTAAADRARRLDQAQQLFGSPAA